MVILLLNNVITGTVPTEADVPEGFQFALFEGDTPITQLYYDVATSRVKVRPPRPGREYDWDGQQWVTRVNNTLDIAPKDNYIGTPLYRWAVKRLTSDNSVLLPHITAMCCDAANVRDELRSAVKVLRDMRDANANTPT